MTTIEEIKIGNLYKLSERCSFENLYYVNNNILFSRRLEGKVNFLILSVEKNINDFHAVSATDIFLKIIVCSSGEIGFIASIPDFWGQPWGWSIDEVLF